MTQRDEQADYATSLFMESCVAHITKPGELDALDPAARSARGRSPSSRRGSWRARQGEVWSAASPIGQFFLIVVPINASMNQCSVWAQHADAERLNEHFERLLQAAPRGRASSVEPSYRSARSRARAARYRQLIYFLRKEGAELGWVFVAITSASEQAEIQGRLMVAPGQGQKILAPGSPATSGTTRGAAMSRRRIERPGVRAGYDRWSASYDATPNPVVALDRRYTLARARPAARRARARRRLRHGRAPRGLVAAGSRALGLDFSRGMLRVARRNAPGPRSCRPISAASFPVRAGGFDALLSSLVSEHLTDLRRFFRECFGALRRGGRLVFSAFHPEPALAGIEANFEQDGTEYRLGAERYSVDDYLNHIADAGFRAARAGASTPGERRCGRDPGAARHLGRPLLLLVCAERAR